MLSTQTYVEESTKHCRQQLAEAESKVKQLTAVLGNSRQRQQQSGVQAKKRGPRSRYGDLDAAEDEETQAESQLGST